MSVLFDCVLLYAGYVFGYVGYVFGYVGYVFGHVGYVFGNVSPLCFKATNRYAVIDELLTAVSVYVGCRRKKGNSAILWQTIQQGRNSATG